MPKILKIFYFWQTKIFTFRMKNISNIIPSFSDIKVLFNRNIVIQLKKIIRKLGNYSISTLNYRLLLKFFKKLRIPEPQTIWNIHIKKFLIVNKIGILGTIALHLIIIIIFLFIKIQVAEKLEDSGLIFEFETEMVEIPLLAEEDRFKDNENRRNIAVNQDDPNNDQIEDYTQDYNFNNEEIERIVSENIQKVYKETHDETIDDIQFDDLEIQKSDDQLQIPNKDSLKIYKGPTNIFYNLEDRSVTNLAVPVYKCEGSGTVVVEIKVNQRGYVINAKVISGDASENQCLVTAAKKAALKTRFNHNVFAPFRQTGSITYNFIAQ